MKHLSHIVLPTFFILGQFFSVIGSFTYGSRPTNSREDETQCYCNASQIFTQLPHFIKTFAQDERFSWTFQGKPGERGPEGPSGPPGLRGRNGNGEKGEPGEPGRPGETVYRHQSPEKGEIGNSGYPGRPGIKGNKGESGVPFTTVLKPDGSYYEVKGEKGMRGRRGHNGEAGLPGAKGDRGISIEGEKGTKGEPAILPDIELLRGPEGLRGPPGVRGLPGRSGPCCGKKDGKFTGDSPGPFIIPMPGPPGISIQGDKGEKGLPGPSPEITLIPGASLFKTESDMRLVRSRPGTICFIEEDEKVFIRVKNGWKEIPLGALKLDRADPSNSYSVADNQQFDPVHRHDLNEVEEKPYFRERIRNERYLKKIRSRSGTNV